MVSAIASITGVSIGPVDPNGQNLQLVYYVEFSGSVSDGTTKKDFNSTPVLPAFVFTAPLGTAAKKVDRLLRESMASLCLDAGFAIDPDDICIPFS